LCVGRTAKAYKKGCRALTQDSKKKKILIKKRGGNWLTKRQNHRKTGANHENHSMQASSSTRRRNKPDGCHQGNVKKNSRRRVSNALGVDQSKKIKRPGSCGREMYKGGETLNLWLYPPSLSCESPVPRPANYWGKEKDGQKVKHREKRSRKDI